MSIYVILGTPGAFDFEAFGESTRKTLALFAPLVALQHRGSKIAPEILSQITDFVRAIRLGVDPAQRGFTATEDILTLTRLMDSTTLQDRTEYLEGTLELADQAYSKAQEAFQEFRDIRTKIFAGSLVQSASRISTLTRSILKLTNKYNTVAENIASTSSSVARNRREDAARRSIDEFRRSIHSVLEEFGNQISALVQWWDWIKIDTRIERNARSNRISFDDSSLRQGPVERWKLLRNQFADYTNMIGQLEDSYPEPLLRSSSGPIPPKRMNYSRPDLQQAVRLITGTKSPNYPDDTHNLGCGCVIV